VRLRSPIFLLLALAAVLFGVNAGGPFPSLTAYVTSGTLLLAWVWTWLLGRTLSVTLSAEGRRFTVGDQAPITLYVENQGPLPVPRLELADRSGLDPPAAPPQPMALGPFAERRLTRTLVLDRRGRYRAGPVEVAFGDPFGLFEIRRRVHGGRRFVVYPREARVTSLPLRCRQPFGRVPTRLRAHQDPTSIADVRPMVPGDSPRFIHWKASARRGELHVKEFELRASTEIMLVLDMQQAVQAGTGGRCTDETAASLALGIARFALRRDLPVGLLALSSRRVRLAPGRGRRHLWELRERLVDLQPDGTVPLARWLAREAAALTPASSLVVITPRLDRTLARLLLRIRRGGVDVIVLHLLAETFDAGRAPEPFRAGLRDMMAAHGIAVLGLGADGQGWDALQETPPEAGVPGVR